MSDDRSLCQTILVVEDDKTIREVIQHTLEIEGYAVLTAEDGQAALDVLKTAPRPCLILLDLMLPVKTGWEFLDELRKHSDFLLAALPVVITSAAGTAALTATKQAQGYIKKPIDLELLLNVVEKFCGPPPDGAK